MFNWSWFLMFLLSSFSPLLFRIFFRLLFGSWRLWLRRFFIIFRLIFSRIITVAHFSSFIRLLFSSKLWKKFSYLFLDPTEGVMRIRIFENHSLRIFIFLLEFLPLFSLLFNTPRLLFSPSALLLLSLANLLLPSLLLCLKFCLFLAV